MNQNSMVISCVKLSMVASAGPAFLPKRKSGLIWQAIVNAVENKILQETWQDVYTRWKYQRSVRKNLRKKLLDTGMHAALCHSAAIILFSVPTALLFWTCSTRV